MSIPELYQLYIQHPQICTDTRAIIPGCIFFAIRGDNFNGNTFAAKALELGAEYSVVDEKEFAVNEKIILVDDVLATLQKLAHHHRQQLHIPVLAITGSNGKTTSKELIHTALSSKYNASATKGNLNNHLGVPLTLLAITKDVEIAIVEMGANHQQEIKDLCSIATPDFGIITNVGYAHLEGFGGFEGVKKGKKELYDYIHLKNGTIFINADDSDLLEMAANVEKKINYGTGAFMEVSGYVIGVEPSLNIAFRVLGSEVEYKMHTQLIGEYNLSNVLAAICVANYFKVAIADIIKSIENYSPDNNRSQLIRSEHNTIIMDAYNANPSSMKAAIDNFSKLNAAKKIVILGDMFELGEESPACHRDIISFVKEKGFSQAFFCGKYFYKNKNEDFLFFQTTEDLIQHLNEIKYQAYTILLKGSRGMKLEQVINKI